MISASLFHLLHLASLAPTLGVAILWVREREQIRATR
jgi:hypothetical protein